MSTLMPPWMVDPRSHSQNHKIDVVESIDRKRRSMRVEAPCQALFFLARHLRPAPLGPAGHPKLPHLWPVKLPQAGRSDYAYSAAVAMREAASFRR